jgi:hypothetical protein
MAIQRHRSTGEPPAATESWLQFIGNATVLLQWHGFTLLTDPNFVHAGEKVPIGYGLTTTRLRDPALEIEELPPIDLVLLSHYHGDHFDQVAEERLDRSLPIVTTPEAANTLSGKGFENAHPLETWESHEVAHEGGLVRITAMPGRHAPAALTIALPPVMGSLLEFWSSGSDMTAGPADMRLYITGDTLMYEGLRDPGAASADRHRAASPGPHARHGADRDDGRGAGRRADAHRPAAAGDPDPLRRLRSLQVTVVRLRIRRLRTPDWRIGSSTSAAETGSTCRKTTDGPVRVRTGLGRGCDDARCAVHERRP